MMFLRPRWAGKMQSFSIKLSLFICLGKIWSCFRLKCSENDLLPSSCVCVIQQSYDILLLILMVLLLVQAVLTSATVVHCATYKSRLRMGPTECDDSLQTSTQYCEVTRRGQSWEHTSTSVWPWMWLYETFANDIKVGRHVMKLHCARPSHTFIATSLLPLSALRNMSHVLSSCRRPMEPCRISAKTEPGRQWWSKWHNETTLSRMMWGFIFIGHGSWTICL